MILDELVHTRPGDLDKLNLMVKDRGATTTPFEFEAMKEVLRDRKYGVI